MKSGCGLTPTGALRYSEDAASRRVRGIRPSAAMAPNALAAAKELVDEAPGRSLREQLAAERDQFLETLFHGNGEEGLQAFLGKRAARFS